MPALPVAAVTTVALLAAAPAAAAAPAGGAGPSAVPLLVELGVAALVAGGFLARRRIARLARALWWGAEDSGTVAPPLGWRSDEATPEVTRSGSSGAEASAG